MTDLRAIHEQTKCGRRLTKKSGGRVIGIPIKKKGKKERKKEEGC
jgi:hypothetical protein